MRDRRSGNRLLLAGGALGPALFVAVFLVEGATRRGYSPVRHQVSLLSLGPAGWIQVTNFVVSGLLLVCFAAGLRQALPTGAGSTWGPILAGVAGVALIISGIFKTEPFNGYPPGVPSGATSTHSVLHMIGGLLFFASLSATCLVLAPRFAGASGSTGWRAYSVASGVMVAVFLIMSGSAGDTLGHTAGLFQRASVIAGSTWMMLVAVRLIVSPSSVALSP